MRGAILKPLPKVHLVRHGDTAWSIAGRHTGRSDIPLTSQGEEAARRLAPRLAALAPAYVWTSPLQRARRTCELAGFDPQAVVDADLAEWDYGTYDGQRSEEIRALRPDWNLFRDGCPEGESPADVARRAERVMARARAVEGDTLLFAHSHILRVLAATWLGLSVDAARYFVLGTTSLSTLGYEHERPDEPVLHLWNELR